MIEERYVVTLNGKRYPLYAGVLAEAFRKGLDEIETELVQAPSEANGNVAIVRATVRMPEGKRFSEYGDASPQNVPPRLVGALIRMAATRAKGRALRDAVNCGETLLEELPDHDGEEGVRDGGRKRGVARVDRSEPPKAPGVVQAPGAGAVGGTGQTAQGLARGDRPPPAQGEPDPFGATYHVGAKALTRQSLLRALGGDLTRARELGLPVPGELAHLENYDNDALYQAGLSLRHRLRAYEALEASKQREFAALEEVTRPEPEPEPAGAGAP